MRALLRALALLSGCDENSTSNGIAAKTVDAIRPYVDVP
jgi:hypothetical protein